MSKKKKMLIMTPGPTQVRKNVRMARCEPTTNPDLDPNFYELYQQLCLSISTLLGTKNESFLLSGEGILGLEAACASLTEENDRVLVLDNGVFGKGFAEFVELYGGKVEQYKSDYTMPFDVNQLREYLIKDHNFKYATMVHCDTPSGVLNPIHTICPLLKSFGILTVVDAVSSMFGEPIDVDESQIDIVCGGSQKVLSAPPGITLITVSEDAFMIMEKRKTKIASFYGNLLKIKGYEKRKWFPYTMPISDILGIKEAIENILEEKGIFNRHRMIAQGVREALEKGGLSLYLEDGFSNTITGFCVPAGLSDQSIISRLWEKHNILIAGSFDVFSGKLLRIGHMGENARVGSVKKTLAALEEVLEELGFPCEFSMKESFFAHCDKWVE